jgi:mannose-6-phosphate isomerase-like protein (cupin superfamily)
VSNLIQVLLDRESVQLYVPQPGEITVTRSFAFLLATLPLMIVVSPVAAQTTAPPSHDPSAHDVCLNTSDLKWDKLVPELGAGSPEITILRVDPKTGATQLMIRSPANYHAPRHWHTANETHTVIYGTWTMKHDGGEKEKELGPGGFNYMPGKVVHEGWAGPEGNLLFITVDGPWDLHLVK